MHLTCQRDRYTENGVFSTWTRDDGSVLMVSVTLAVPDEYNSWRPIVPPGDYVMKPYASPTKGDVWQIMDVPGHTYILLHSGNWEYDSLGCEVVGERVIMGVNPKTHQPQEMVTNSRKTMKKLMKELEGLDRCSLTVKP